MVGIVRLGKPLAAALLALLPWYLLKTTITASASLARVGEFSVILAGPCMTLGVLPAVGYSPIRAGALVSIALKLLVFAAVEPVLRRVRGHSARARTHDHAQRQSVGRAADGVRRSCLSSPVVNVGYSRVWHAIVMALKANAVAFALVVQGRALVERTRDQGQALVLGNAAEPAALIQAHVVQARLLVLAMPQTLAVRQIVASARTLNLKVVVVGRSHSTEEVTQLVGEAAGTVPVARKRTGARDDR